MLEDASYEEVLTIQVRRHRLEEWVDKPFFDRVLRGCMVWPHPRDPEEPALMRPTQH